MSSKLSFIGADSAAGNTRLRADAAPGPVTRRQAWRNWATRRFTLASALAAVTIAMTLPATASASCGYRSAYFTNNNFWQVGVVPYSIRFTADVCSTNPLRYVWYSPSISGEGWVEHYTEGLFWDPSRYGGSWTFWANVTATYSPNGYSQETYYRIWVKPNGQTYVYAGF